MKVGFVAVTVVLDHIHSLLGGSDKLTAFITQNTFS